LPISLNAVIFAQGIPQIIEVITEIALLLIENYFNKLMPVFCTA